MLTKDKADKLDLIKVINTLHKSKCRKTTIYILFEMGPLHKSCVTLYILIVKKFRAWFD